jgi:tetratricopeptide (TPR) repeat protein
MNNTNPNSDLLVDYMDANLSHEETIKVEAMLQNDKTLQTEYDNIVLAKSAIQYYGIKQQVNFIHQNVMANKVAEQPAKTSQGLLRSITKWSMRIAASLLVVVLGLGVYQYATISPDKLFDENYSAFTLGVTRGETNLTAIGISFEEKKYEKVIDLIKNLADPTQKENFLLGQAYLETKDYSKAIMAFNTVLAQNKNTQQTIFNDDVEYYLAMSYLKNKQLDLAKPIFENINNNDTHLYNDKVTSAFMRNLKLLSWKK